MTSEVAMQLITDATEARACFDALVNACAKVADSEAPHRVGFRSGGVTATAYFFHCHGIWAMPTDGSQLSKSKNRYWNCFGLGGNPDLASASIAVEINHPHVGKSNVTGRFFTTGDRFFIGHTGRIGGGVKGFDGSALERAMGHSGLEVEIDGRLQHLAFLSPLDPSEAFVERLAQFVRLMSAARERIKAEAARRRPP